MKYSELSFDAQNAAYDDFIQFFDSFEWESHSEDIITAEVDYLEDSTGGYNIKVQYDGFYMQGSGASFTGFVNVQTFIEKCLADKNRYPLLWYIIQNNDLDDEYVEIYRTDNHHSHEKSTRVGEVGIRGGLSAIQRYVETEIEQLREDMQSWIENSSIEIYKQLKDVYESLTDRDSYEDDMIRGNIEFDEYGNQIETPEESEE